MFNGGAMKNICVITGASSGIGKEFFKSLISDSDFSFDEIWVIARSSEKLEALQTLTDIKVRAIPLDLSREESYNAYRELLAEENPRVRLLVNCSGFGKFESVEKVGVCKVAQKCISWSHQGVLREVSKRKILCRRASLGR